MNVHAILICIQASKANAHLLGQCRISGIFQLVTHLGIIAYAHSFQSTEYLKVYYKVNMYTHARKRVEEDNIRSECDTRHTIPNVTLSPHCAYTLGQVQFDDFITLNKFLTTF